MRKLEFTDTGGVKYPQDNGWHRTKAQEKKVSRWVGVLYLLMFLFLVYGFQFTGRTAKEFASPDNSTQEYWETYRNDAKVAGIVPHWNPYLFMGMPNVLVTSHYVSFSEHPFVWIYGRVFRISDIRIILLLYFSIFGVMLFFNIKHLQAAIVSIWFINIFLNIIKLDLL